MTDTTPRWSELLLGKNALRSFVLASGVALHAINVYIATTIMPSVVRDIGGIDYYSWNTTFFISASILASAGSAQLLSRTGPRRAYLVASGSFLLGSVLCGTAPSMAMMLVGRAVQGLGGGFLFALSYAMIRIVFPERFWSRAMALVSGMWGIATLVGPAVGGVFAQYLSWRAAFGFLCVFSVLFTIAAVMLLSERESLRSEERSALPVTQLGLLTLAVIVISATSTSPNLVWNVSGIAAAAVLLCGLVVIERGKTSRKLLPSGAFDAHSELAALYASIGLLAATVTSGEIFMPLFLQVLHRQSPLVAGYVAALMAAGWTLGSIASSGAVERGIRRALVGCPLMVSAGMVALTILVPREGDGSALGLVPMCAALVAIGWGVGMAWPHLLTFVMKAAPRNQEGMVSTSITTVQLFATALGAALAGTIVNAAGLVEPGGASGTSSAAYWLFGLFVSAPLLCEVTVLRAVRTHRRQASTAPISTM